MIINSEESEINKILSKEEGLVELVTDIIEPKGEKKFYHQIISSAIDVDRADYLVRDSYYTGTSYGYVDLD
jgi:HD superfamily phosphohydrolase